MNSLYLSYDGMTDPLGGSQVIPYLRGLARKGHSLTLVSFEKPDRFERGGEELARSLAEAGIRWKPLRYHKDPPILSTLWDILRLRAEVIRLAGKAGFDLVHCRGYVSALVGMALKKSKGTRFLFDMRGFWPDERVDGGLWKQERWIYRMVYRYFKKKELEFLEAADSIVSLTHAGKSELQTWKISERAKERIQVIPCCSDLEHFHRKRVPEEARAEWMRQLRLGPEDLVISYLGSLGTWYLLDEMLVFFKELLEREPRAKLLFITADEPDTVFRAAEAHAIPPEALRVRAASRAEVPALLSLCRLGLFFIRPSYSKKASSPTKMGEYLGMGIPVIANAGVGDADWLFSRYRIGQAVRELAPGGYREVLEALPGVLAMEPFGIRGAAEDYFSLQKGIERYHEIYLSLGKT